MSSDCQDGDFLVALSQVNAAVKKLAGKDRTKAVQILGKFGARDTTQLKREDYRAALDLVNAELVS